MLQFSSFIVILLSSFAVEGFNNCSMVVYLRMVKLQCKIFNKNRLQTTFEIEHYEYLYDRLNNVVSSSQLVSSKVDADSPCDVNMIPRCPKRFEFLLKYSDFVDGVSKPKVFSQEGTLSSSINIRNISKDYKPMDEFVTFYKENVSCWNTLPRFTFTLEKATLKDHKDEFLQFIFTSANLLRNPNEIFTIDNINTDYTGKYVNEEASKEEFEKIKENWAVKVKRVI